jgi:hypothetical protein
VSDGQLQDHHLVDEYRVAEFGFDAFMRFFVSCSGRQYQAPTPPTRTANTLTLQTIGHDA